jgi:syntaxin 16
MLQLGLSHSHPRPASYLDELNRSDRYQKNTGRRKIIFLLLLIIFGLIVVLIFKPRHHPPSTIMPSDPVPSPDNFVPVPLYPRIP